MAFNDRLKESRTTAGLTQEQLSERLGIAKSTLSGYESGNREPSIATVAKLLDILNIDANYLYQDEVKKIVNAVVSTEEKSILEEYRKLDDYGKEAIKYTLNRETERIERENKLKKVQLSIYTDSENRYLTTEEAERLHLMPNAAHERTDIEATDEMKQHDDNLMSNDKNWE